MTDQTVTTAQLDALLVRGSDDGFVRAEEVRELTEALELDRSDLDELNALFESHGIEPEFHLPIITFHVNVRRLIAISGIEEEPIRPRDATDA